MKKLITFILSTSLSLTSFAFDTSKPVSVIIPFNPGGGTDLLFRSFQKYTDTTQVKVSPVYKPGAAGAVGVNELVKSPADGYTVAIVPSPSMKEAIKKNPDIKVTVVSGLGSSIWAVAVNSNSSIKTFADLEAKLKAKDKVVFGSGAAGQTQFMTEMTTSMGVGMPVVANFNGAGPAVTNLLGNHVDLIAVPMGTMKSHADAGTLKIIATFGTDLDGIVNLEKKYPNWKSDDLFGFLLPPNASPDAVTFWSKYIEKFLTDPNTKKLFSEVSVAPSKFGVTDYTNAMK